MAHASGYTFSPGSTNPGDRDMDPSRGGAGVERHYKGGKMKNWIIEQVNSRQFPGLEWVDKEQSKFKVPWRHAKKKGYNRDRDAALFKEWAIFTGKFAKHSDPTIWKINFRCALNSLKDIKECKEEHSEAFKVYQILPFPQKAKKLQRKDIHRGVSKHESLANIPFNRGPIMPFHSYQIPTAIDYTSKFQPVHDVGELQLELQLRDIDITNIKSQPPSNLTADSPFSEQMMDREAAYSASYPPNLLHHGAYPDFPDIVITNSENVDTNPMDSNIPSNISEPSMGTNYGAPATNMSADQSIADEYRYYGMLLPNDESLLGLPPGIMHMPVSRSKSMDELSSQNLLAFSNFDNNIYKSMSTGNLGGQATWEMYYPHSAGSSMSSIAPEDFMRIFKSEYLSDSGESNSEYAQSGTNSYPPSNITLPPCGPQPILGVGDIPLVLNTSQSVESETDNPNLYIDVANDSKFGPDYNFSTY